MKKITLLFMTFILAFAINGWGQTTINNVTFEAAGGYATSITEFTDGGGDFFIRTDGSNISGAYVVSNIQGSYYFAAQDIDGEGATLPVTLTIDDVDISGYTSLQLKVYLAEDDDGSNQDWDGPDYVHFDYDIDNSGTFTNLLWIESDITGTNGEPKIDTDYDGVGDGTPITSTFAQFTQAIAGTGSLIDIKVTFYLNSGDEDIAIDNIEIFGSNGGNPPPVITNVSHTPEVPLSTESVSVSADVTDDVSVFGVELHWGTASGSLTNNIDMSNTSGDTYTTDTDIPAQADGTTVYYEVYALDDEAEETTSYEYNYTVLDPATTTLPYTETFDADLGDCYTYSVSGASKEWHWNSDGSARANGYGSVETEEDWLIIPSIDFSSYSGEFMTFDTYMNYGTGDDETDHYLKLYYSTDYSGLGDPSGSIWTELSYTQPSSSSTWTSSGTVDLSTISGSAYLAFKYRYTGDYREWRVDNISVQETTSDPEPTNYPTAFAASADGGSAITTSWTDDAIGSQLPSGYVVYANLTGIFTPPVDGIPIVDDPDMSDDEGVVNIAFGVETYQWTGLLPSTQYYFTIYPYTNSAATIDYKIDGTPPTATETTESPNLDLLISEIADPKGTGNHIYRFVELFNTGLTNINFNSDVWYLCKQINGSPTNWKDIQLSGSINTDGVFVIATSTTDFNTAYGFNPDQAHSEISGNGDDGYFLYYGGGHATGTLIDAYGVIDQDGSNYDWKYEDRKAVRLHSVTNPNSTWIVSEWDIPSAAYVADMTPKEHKEDVTWAGAGTTPDNWNEKGANWSGTYGYIPDASFNVTIPSTTVSPVIYDESACNALTIQSDAALDISVNGSLTTYGLLDIASSKTRGAANFTIKSDATGNGSYIGEDMMFGEVTVERYVEGYTGNNGWHQISSPIDFMTIAGSDFAPGANDDLYEWMEQTNTWHNYKSTGSFTEFYGSQGYLVAYENTATKQFVGQLTGWDYYIENLTYTAFEGNGWHLLGNPYPSAIEWNTPDWALTHIGDIAEIWDESAGNYALINAGDVIPSTNGFFVQVESSAYHGDNSLNIPASARVHNTTNNYKNVVNDEMQETLVIKSTNDENTYFDVNRIGFMADATMEWDIEFDAHKLMGSSNAPQLWTVSNEEKFAQNYLPYVYENFQLPLNFKAGANTTHHLNFEGIESFYVNSEIYLEDLFLDKVIDLREQQLYTFSAAVTDETNRFILHFYGVTSTDENIENEVHVYSDQKTVYIRSSQLPKDVYNVEVFNAMGQLVFSDKLEPSTLNTIVLNQNTGVYIVRVNGNDQTTVSKVMIK